METCSGLVTQFGRERKHNSLGFPSNVDQGAFISCTICPESFSDSTSLYEHTLSHHNCPQAKLLKCALCRKRVPDYLQHLRLHVKEQHAGPLCASPAALDWGEVYFPRGPVQEEIVPAHAPCNTGNCFTTAHSETKRGGPSVEAEGNQPQKQVLQPSAAEGPSVGSTTTSTTETASTLSTDVEKGSSIPPRTPVETDSDALRERFVQQLLVDAFSLDR